MDKFLTTADVPPQFLKGAYLVGDIPLRALASDTRVSYTLYIPPKHYNPSPSATPGDGESTNKKLPLLIYVPGTKRHMTPMHSYLAPFADSTPCAVLAPLFPCYIEGPNDLESYTVLRSATLRYDLVLLSILDEVAQYWPGIETSKVFMMGFSAGGQFAHRFLYLYPERVAAISIGSQSHTTALDKTKDWPVGIANVETLFSRAVNKELIRNVPIQLVIGSEDNRVEEEFWEWVDQMKTQGGDQETIWLTRMRRARDITFREFRAMLEENDIKTQLDVVEGVAHVGDAVQEHVLRFLQPLIRERVPSIE